MILTANEMIRHGPETEGERVLMDAVDSVSKDIDRIRSKIESSAALVNDAATELYSVVYDE